MRDEHDFTDATRGSAVKHPGKTRITVLLDGDVVAAFRARAKDTGRACARAPLNGGVPVPDAAARWRHASRAARLTRRRTADPLQSGGCDSRIRSSPVDG